jgi:hypothetical protein
MPLTGAAASAMTLRCRNAATTSSGIYPCR